MQVCFQADTIVPAVVLSDHWTEVDLDVPGVGLESGAIFQMQGSMLRFLNLVERRSVFLVRPMEGHQPTCLHDDFPCPLAKPSANF